MENSIQRAVSISVNEPVAPFTRLCQVYVMLGKILSHHYNEKLPSKTLRFGMASQLYVDGSILARRLTEEAGNSADYLDLAAPLALSFSALSTLCDPYSCPTNGAAITDPEQAAMQVQALEGLKTVSTSVVEFANQIMAATPLPQDLDRISPLIMDALYSAAANYAWLVRESGDEDSQMALESLRHCLRRLGSRWRNAAEYLRILEAQEFTYAIGSAA